MVQNGKNYETIPVGPLAIMAHKSIQPLCEKVDRYIAEWRSDSNNEHKSTIAFKGYEKDSYLVNFKSSRFGSGEAKCVITQTVRGDDIFIMADVTNHSLSYSLCGHENHMSPDDIYQDIKRCIAAISGKAKRISVIMPFLYESRQHRRTARESMDCALALQELINMGVDNIITFDAHDPRVQNAIPLNGFETVQPTYQFIKALLRAEPDLTIDADHMMMISPDEGAMGRVVYYANVLGIDMGMFYKRRDYTKIVNGRNPIVAHEFLGTSVEGKDVWIIDDMVSSGDSLIDVARELKKRKARKVFAATTFGLFTNGLERFDQAYEEGLIDKILTTNLIYQDPELFSKPWYVSVDMSKYCALLIDTLNHDASISTLLSPTDKINKIVAEYNKKKNA
jgi:ribose-phosphate pyrophosphokinase